MKKNTDKTEQKQSRYRGLKPFKKGQSGNPKGRPKGSLSITTEMKKMLENGKLDELKKIIWELVRKKKWETIKTLWEYVDGKPKESIDITEIKTKVDDKEFRDFMKWRRKHFKKQ